MSGLLPAPVGPASVSKPGPSAVSAFCVQMIRFFDSLTELFPEERDIRLARDAMKMAKESNPRLIVDLFYEHVYMDMAEPIVKEDVPRLIQIGRMKIATQFNEMMSAMSIFDSHWPELTDSSKNAIFQYLKVLVVLCARVRGIVPPTP